MIPVDVAIADDHPLIRMALRRTFDDDGRFRVALEAPSAGALLDGLSCTPCAIVITDFSMPATRAGDDGFRLLRRLASLDTHPAIVVLTMVRHPAALRYMARAGARALVSKEDGMAEIVRACAALSRPGATYHSPAVRRFAQCAPPPGAGDELTMRELEVIRFVAQGHSVATIAGLIHRSASTVAVHRKHAMRKVGATVSAELVRYAYDHGLA